MFFKMLKKDLKDNIGLNIVVFIFITVAAALVFLGSVQLYSGFWGKTYNEDVCKNPAAEFIFRTGVDNHKEKTAYAEDVIKNSVSFVNEMLAEEGKPSIDGFEYEKHLMLDGWTIDFENHEEKSGYDWYLTTLPQNANLIYDIDNKTFYVENGKIAVPRKLADIAGAKIGDKVKFTAEDGYIFEFEISHLTKDPVSDILYWYRFVISDADFEYLMKHSCRLYTSFSFFSPEDTNTYYMLLSYFLNYDMKIKAHPLDDRYTDSSTFNYIITVFIMLISFFMILVVFMTVRFTMVAAIKEQEKEIGMMKAIGSDTFAFRWLFCAKYIAFAIVGGIIGVIGAFPLSDIVSDIFTPENIDPEPYMLVIIGIVSALIVIAAIIIFSLLVMHRINKISPVDAIHGENRGERFSKGFPMFMHKRKIMPESFCLALVDVLGRAKRYIFLAVVYILGTTIMLATFNLKNSVISEDYLKYNMEYNYDFNVNLTNEEWDEVVSRTGLTDRWEALNADLKNHGIPAEYDCSEEYQIELIIDDKYEPLFLLFNNDNFDKLDYQPGGTAPVLDNEIAISSYTADKYGFEVGQRIKAVVILSDNGVDRYDEEREYVISGFVNYMEMGGGIVIMGGKHDDLYSSGKYRIAANINTPEAEKDDVIQQMKELYGDDNVLNTEEAVLDWFGDGYEELFNLLMIIMGGAVIFITVLVTYLCSTVFISEETSDIALMKSIGISTGTIKLQYVFRFVILLAVSVPLSILFLKTGIQFFAGELFAFLNLKGFKFLWEFPVTFIIIPLIISLTVITVAFIKINSTKDIQISDITKE